MRGYGKYSGSDRTIKLLNAKLTPGFPLHQRLVASGRLEHDNTINGVQRVVVGSMNAAIHMRDANGKAHYSFSLDKSGCVTQLPCVFGSALRGDGGGADTVYCCAAAPTRSPPVSSLTMHNKRLMHISPRAIATRLRTRRARNSPTTRSSSRRWSTRRLCAARGIASLTTPILTCSCRATARAR